jgi:HlyD family secretion protein
MRHKFIILTIILALTTLTLRAYYGRQGSAEPVVATAAVTRGDVVSAVSATGTIEAVTMVQVGTQVSGAIESLNADFNSIVRKGQVLARLEPSLYQSAIEQARANLERAEADLDRLKVTTADAAVKLARAQDLSARQLIAAIELEAAQVAVQSSAAQVRSSAAQVTQARAALAQANVNLQKTVITSPIDGIVIARNVDVGQTVAASLSAPVLFEIAADLSQMRLNASIDESDLGRIAAGQIVEFTVDAYPGERFSGEVRQVRLNPTVVSNVVTYAAIITAPNPELKLKPGMTANLNVEVARGNDVLRVPSAALRFRPSADLLKALGAPAPERLAADSGTAIVWQWVDGVMHPVTVRTGVSDGTQTEIAGALDEGAQVITRVTVAADQNGAQAASPSSSPLMGAQPPRR